jgi:hypothetical protein
MHLEGERVIKRDADHENAWWIPCRWCLSFERRWVLMVAWCRRMVKVD